MSGRTYNKADPWRDIDAVAAEFSAIPFENHEARRLAFAYFNTKAQLSKAEKEIRHLREVLLERCL